MTLKTRKWTCMSGPRDHIKFRQLVGDIEDPIMLEHSKKEEEKKRLHCRSGGNDNN